MDKQLKYRDEVEKWDIFEAAVEGPQTGNPFIDHHIEAVFLHKSERKRVEGFYDGAGIYKVRFMPSFEGEYRFTLSASFFNEDVEGVFKSTAPGENNRGPVRVANTCHFAYEDGTPYYSVGTTCYVWTHQSQEMQEETLKSLEEGGFNKIRFCIFPKHYDFNLNEPVTYPYEGTPCDNSVLTKENFHEYSGAAPGNDWDFTRFNPAHFQNIEKRIRNLMVLGIEADIIVMHPYDRWGFSCMTREADDLYWKYVLARFSAYRNVWWSLANEYDLMPAKTMEDWEHFADLICRKDPYGHLRSIHNCGSFYDYSRPWITHCSIQRQDVYKTAEYTDQWRERYRKPVVLDEIVYEGNIHLGWGNISAKELVRRFWEGSLRGGYAGHGETYMHPEDKLWWSHGGKLHGQSPARIRFLHSILCETPGYGLTYLERQEYWDEVTAVPDTIFSVENGGRDYSLHYYGFSCPSFKDFYYDDEYEYQAEVIDTWEMTITDAGTHRGKFRVELPGKEYMAVRIRKVD